MATSCLRSTLLHVDPMATIRRCPHMTPSQTRGVAIAPALGISEMTSGAPRYVLNGAYMDASSTRVEQSPRRILETAELDDVQSSAAQIDRLFHCHASPPSCYSIASSFDFAAFEASCQKQKQLPDALLASIIGRIDEATLWKSVRLVSRSCKEMAEHVLFQHRRVSNIIQRHLSEVRLPFQHHWDHTRKHRSFDPLYRDIFCTVSSVQPDADQAMVRLVLQPSYKRQQVRLTMRRLHHMQRREVTCFFRVNGERHSIGCSTVGAGALVLMLDMRRVYAALFDDD